MTKIRLAQLNDLPLYREHQMRHFSESGQDGDLIFMPHEEPEDISLENLQRKKAEPWNASPLEIGWERSWILTDDSRIYGEVKLMHRPPLKTSLHRAVLAMGIERSHRGQGWGSKLMTEAIAWAKAQPSLDWLQLYVFAHNEPAQRLYRKFGFKEVGRTPDMFRVHGQSIDDIEMVLKLR